MLDKLSNASTGFAAFAITGILSLLLPRLSIAQQVIIEVNTPSPDDDYLCWSPTKALAKLSQPMSSDVTTTISGKSDSELSGKLHFQTDNGQRPTKQTFSPQEQLSIVLKKDASPTTFWVAGIRPSRGNKDVAIVATASPGTTMGTLPVMVRVRKNAEDLSDHEKHLFLTAVRELHIKAHANLRSEYIKYSRTHDEAFLLGIHNAPAGYPLFAAWHRAFLLSVERELQSIDPRVSLPYWRFDRPAPKLFSPDFLGRVQNSGPSSPIYEVEFSQNNPLFQLKMGEDEGPIKRTRNGDTSPPVESTRLQSILNNSQLDFYEGFNGTLELNYHNGPHTRIGGWMGSASSPRDPLFYLLHANVDRAWAQWQSRYDKFILEQQDESIYSALGRYPGTSDRERFRKGSYALDIMWPWNKSEGNQNTPDDAMDDWPLFDFTLPMPRSSQAHMSPVRPADQLDYLDYQGKSLTLGACYDDIKF